MPNNLSSIIAETIRNENAKIEKLLQEYVAREALKLAIEGTNMDPESITQQILNTLPQRVHVSSMNYHRDLVRYLEGELNVGEGCTPK